MAETEKGSSLTPGGQQHANSTTSNYQFIMAPNYILRISNAVSITAIFLNIFHIAVVASMPKTKVLSDKNFRIFVIYLSAVNLVMMTEQTILDNKKMQFVMFEYHGLCVLSATVLHSQIVYCGWLLLCVSVERLLATFSPLNYQNYFYIRKFGWPLVISHIAVTGLYVAIAVLFYNRAYSVKGSGCCQMGSEETPQLGIVTLGQGFLILFTISILYIILLAKGNRMMSAAPSSSGSVRRRQKTQTMQRQLNFTIGAILTSKFIGWLPLMIMIILRNTPYDFPMLDYVGRITLHLFSVMTPIAYGFTSSRYRKFVLKKIADMALRRLDDTTLAAATTSKNSGSRASISSTKHPNGLHSVKVGQPYPIRHGMSTVLNGTLVGNAVNITINTLDESGCYRNPIQVEETTIITDPQISTCGDDSLTK